MTGVVALAQLAAAFRRASCITSVCHENPDADTLGAAIAVSIIGERLGKQSEVVSVDRPAPNFDFLPRISSVRERPCLEPDLAVICDAASLERAGRILVTEADWFRRARIANIDHHLSNSGFGDLQLVDASASATCEVVLRLADELGVPLDSELATVLLAGIVRDTQGFADLSTRAETLRITARLTEAGAPLAQIQRRTRSEIPFSTISLWGRLLASMGTTMEGRVVYTVLTQQMLNEVDAEQHDADGIAELMATVRDAGVTILLRELGPTETRVSLRTGPTIDASRIAAALGGGGHKGRAGCIVRMSAADALASTLGAVQAELDAPSTAER